MKKIILSILTIGIALSSAWLYAQQASEKSCFPPVSWTTKGTSDVVTIENGTNLALIINIVVQGTASSPGINIKNCGTTTHVNAGSMAICANNDSANPVSFSSDNSNQPASGTYQIKEQ